MPTDVGSRIGPNAAGPVCQACWDHIIYPNNGSHTPLWEPCMKAVEEACAQGSGDEANYEFCMDDPEDVRTMVQIIKLQNWKLRNCEWAPAPERPEGYDKEVGPHIEL